MKVNLEMDIQTGLEGEFTLIETKIKANHLLLWDTSMIRPILIKELEFILMINSLTVVFTKALQILVVSHLKGPINFSYFRRI